MNNMTQEQLKQELIVTLWGCHEVDTLADKVLSVVLANPEAVADWCGCILDGNEQPNINCDKCHGSGVVARKGNA